MCQVCCGYDSWADVKFSLNLHSAFMGEKTKQTKTQSSQLCAEYLFQLLQFCPRSVPQVSQFIYTNMYIMAWMLSTFNNMQMPNIFYSNAINSLSHINFPWKSTTTHDVWTVTASVLHQNCVDITGTHNIQTVQPKVLWRFWKRGHLCLLYGPSWPRWKYIGMIVWPILAHWKCVLGSRE